MLRLPRLAGVLALVIAAGLESCGGGDAGGRAPGETSPLTAVPPVPQAVPVIAPTVAGRAIDLFVLSPPNGAVIATSTVTVRVDGANWAELWVESSSLGSTASGTQAVRTDAHPFQGDSFALGVPVWDGTNRLVVTGRRPTGQVLTRTLQVVHPPASVEGVRVTVSPSSVQNPATPVQITATSAGIGAPSEAWIDADGDGRLDATFPTSGTLAWTFPAEGYYRPRVVMRVANGTHHDSGDQSETVTITAPPSVTDAPGEFELPVPARDLAVDRFNRQVLVLTQDSRLHVFTEAGALVASHTLAAVQDLVGIDVDEDGNVYAVDRALHQLRKFSRSTGFLPDTTFGTNGVVGSLGTADAQFNEPADVQCLRVVGGVHVWVADAGNGRLQRFDGAGGFQLGLPTGAEMARPVSLVADFAGHVSVLDGTDGDLAVFEFSGTRIAYRTNAVGVDPSTPPRASVDVDQGVLIADPANRVLLRCDRDGAVRASLGIAPNAPVAAAQATGSRTLVAVAGAARLGQLQMPEPMGESPVEVVTRFFTAVHQSADATANDLVAGETAPLLASVLAHPVKGPAYRALAGRVGSASELSRSDRLSTVHAMVDPGTPGAQPIVMELRRDTVTSRWLLLGL